MAQETLTRLYKDQPKAKSVLENAVGYAVFRNTGVKILISGSGKGQGVAKNNKTNREVFMKMFEIQAGLGVGVKKFRLVFIFETEKAFNAFVDSGWELGGQSDAAAKSGEGKGASAAGAKSSLAFSSRPGTLGRTSAGSILTGSSPRHLSSANAMMRPCR